MNIESVEVIPMRKESMFDETPLQSFECSLTTSYDEWKPVIDKFISSDLSEYEKLYKKYEFDGICEKFAKAQKAFMLGPTGIFHDNIYIAKSVALPTAEHLFAMSNTGPLYMVYKEYIDDLEAGKTVERFYRDTITFEKKYGPWYPQKAQYRIRYGIREKRN